MKIFDAVNAAKPYAAKIATGEMKPLPQPPIARPMPPLEPAAGGLNNFLRCPMPGISVAPDSLRQYYRSGIPQHRVIGPSPLTS